MPKKLTTFTMCLNEIEFIRCYLNHVIQYSDQVILIDGGSTDGTVEVIQEYIRKTDYPEIILIQYKQKAEPYSKEWKCGRARNRCLELATGDWILKLDIDELLSDNFKELLPELMSNEQEDVIYGFQLVSFWGDFYHIRLNDEKQKCWSCMIHRMWNNKKLRYPEFHHAGLKPKPKNIINRKDIKLFHLHYGLKVKYNDNRKWELGLTKEQTKQTGRVNSKQMLSKVKTQFYNYEYPESFREYFEFQKNHLNNRNEYSDFCKEFIKYQSILSKDALRVKKLLKYFKGDILEIGCRTGEMTKIMAETANKIVTMDVDFDLVKKAKQQCSNFDNILYSVQFGEDLVYENEFDVVVICELLEHVANDVKIMDVAYKAVKMGGKILISVPVDGFFPNSGHVRHYDRKKLINLIEKFSNNYILDRAGVNLLAVVVKDKNE